MKVCLACQQRFEADNWSCPSCTHSIPSQRGYPVFAPELTYGDGSDATYDYGYIFDVEGKNFWFRSRNRLLFGLWSVTFQGAINFWKLAVVQGLFCRASGKHFQN
jgi:hypothetical protein